MEEKKGFFELLSPQSALIVGVVGGFLVLCSVGFFVMLILNLSGKISFATGGNEAVAVASNTVAPQPDPAPQPTPAPVPNAPKSNKPKVELFVMSYCPFGLQMEKAFVPAWNLLKNKADMDIEFVSYAMHGKKEVDENTRQYCIEKEQPAKYQTYLRCFFNAGQNDGNQANYQQCLQQARINQAMLNNCTARTDRQYGITVAYNDQSKWLSGQFPVYPIYNDLNQKYNVQGSPTLIINGVEASPARTPEAIKEAICAAFNNAPAECNQQLSTTQYQAGFGLLAQAPSAGGSNPGCGT